MAEELRGWKEIGAYFSASDRTVQRWEHEYGMPVHRTGRTRGASVFALPDELAAWRLSPDGLRAGSENVHATGTAVLERAPARAAGSSFVRSRKFLIMIAAAAVIVAVVWATYSRWWSPAATMRQTLTEAYAVPASPLVFLLRITTADGTPFTFHVLDGGMATLAMRGGTKLGFSPVRTGGAAKLVVVELVRTPKGGEGLRELKRVELPPRSPVHFDRPGMSVDIEWRDTLKASDPPAPPPDSRPRNCCIVCGDMTACSAEVSARCGSCCGFGGCVGAK